MSSSSPPERFDPPESPPPAARELFGAHFAQAEAYTALLCDEGTVWGLLGPREPSRIWSRHVAHCALLSDLVGDDREVIDVGSGAGLPGIPLAILRADLRITLLEPLARRVRFLELVIERLALANVVVIQAKALTYAPASADVVTARAVAPLGRLATWTLPLVRAGGELLAIRGASALAEVQAARVDLAGAGAGETEVLTVTHEGLEPLTVVRTTRVSRETGQRKR